MATGQEGRAGSSYRGERAEERCVVDLRDHARSEVGIKFGLGLLHLFDLDGERVPILCARRHEHIVREQPHRSRAPSGVERA